MVSSLYNSKVFPLNQPYNVSPWNLAQEEKISEVKPSYVAWVLVELRNNLTTSSYRKAAILTTDGTILNANGTDFSFNNINNGDYYIAVHHRNHLSIISSVQVPISNQTKINYDFTSSIGSAYGSNSLVSLQDGKFGMFAGDADANGVINNLDFGIVANAIPLKGYAQGDLDMNGMINVLDYSFINKNILKKTSVSK